MNLLSQLEAQDAAVTTTLYTVDYTRDAIRELARDAAEFGVDAKKLELNLGNRLPKIAGKKCP